MMDHLPQLRPDATRRARTIARCHDRLARGRAKRRMPLLTYDRLLVAGLCALYLATMAGDILRIRAAL